MSYTRIPCNAWVDRNDSAAAREPRIGKSLAPTLTVLASLLCCAGVSAQPQRAPAVVDPYLQTVWTTENGLPQNSVTAIVQSRDGYLWLSTFGGLARLDGVRFTIFNSANTPGLKSNRITALLEDRRGILWLGTETGELMSLQDGVGTTYPLGGALEGAIVSSLTGDDAGIMWLGTTKGLARFQDGTFTTYTTADGLPSNLIYTGADVTVTGEALGPRRLALYRRTLGWLGGSLEREQDAPTTFLLRLPELSQGGRLHGA